MLGKHNNFKLEAANIGTVVNIPNDSVKAPSLAMDRTIKSSATHSHTSLFPMSNLMLKLVLSRPWFCHKNQSTTFSTKRIGSLS